MVGTENYCIILDHDRASRIEAVEPIISAVEPPLGFGYVQILLRPSRRSMKNHPCF